MTYDKLPRLMQAQRVVGLTDFATPDVTFAAHLAGNRSICALLNVDTDSNVDTRRIVREITPVRSIAMPRTLRLVDQNYGGKCRATMKNH
jgi:hypothetical protein